MNRSDFISRWRMGSRLLGAFALLLGLIAGYGPQPAEAQVAFTQITNTTGGGDFYPSINSDGTRIALSSDHLGIALNNGIMEKEDAVTTRWWQI